MFWIIENELSTLECLLRIILSGLCGIAIGIERNRRQKDAGIRTHTIMAMGAALAMIVSKYGFLDMMAVDDMRTDGSRIASNILTSVGFLGAGVIFTKGGAIKGLTTAAGIWTMASIGMCIGAGLYTIGILSAVIILAVQIIFHMWMPSSESVNTHELRVDMRYSDKALTDFITLLENKKISVMGTNIRKDEDKGTMQIHMEVRISQNTDLSDILGLVNEIPEILSVNI